MVCEEFSNYPSFLYSVWSLVGITPEDEPASSVEIKHVFHVASKSRLVEAIITGIVNGIASGGGSMDLVLQFSDSYNSYDAFDGWIR